MDEQKQTIDWRKTTFEGSRDEQLRRAQSMSVRQRLEAMNALAELSERLQAMPRRQNPRQEFQPQARTSGAQAEYKLEKP